MKAANKSSRQLSQAALCERSLLGYEDLQVVQSGPETESDKPDMFAGQEEARLASFGLRGLG